MNMRLPEIEKKPDLSLSSVKITLGKKKKKRVKIAKSRKEESEIDRLISEMKSYGNDYKDA